MIKNPKCKNCDIDMEKGFIPDYSYASAFETMWIKGEPDKAKLLGFKIPGIKPPKFKEGIYVEAYRSPNCGLIELYAKNKKESL